MADRRLYSQNEQALYAFRRQSDDINTDPTIIVRSQTTLTWGDGQQRVVKFVERTTDGMKGVLEDTGVSADFPRSARAKRSGNHLDEDNTFPGPEGEGEDAAVFTPEERAAAEALRARRAALEKRKKAKIANAASAGRAGKTASSATRSARIGAMDGRTSATMRRSGPAVNEADGDSPARRSARVSRQTRDGGYESERDTREAQRRREEERERTPVQELRRSRRSAAAAAPSEPAVKHEVQDLDAMLHNFDLASIADSGELFH